ncbi:hypothetical protein C8J57DRAFT_23911 [Mycena rebaudengoi]|nr:hypothetical protein C8J57DRAFT_23911 [Mycena rebaudengoi]
MSTTLASTFSDFVNAITGIFLSLFQSVLAVFQAILVLGKDIVFTIINLAQSTIALAVGVVGGVVNFAAGTSGWQTHQMILIRVYSEYYSNRSPRWSLLLLHNKRREGGKEKGINEGMQCNTQ